MSHRIERVANARLAQFELPAGMTLIRMWALTAIAEAEERAEIIRMTDIAAELGITPRSATAVVDGLERLDLVNRLQDEHDRRTVRVGLTSAASDLMPTIRLAWDDICNYLAAPLEPSERETYVALTRKLISLHHGPAAG